MADWKSLTDLTGERSFVVERVRLGDGTAIEGEFEPPALAKLAAEDQVFVAAFIHCHGSIKRMEKWFGVSYPTIKNRLNRIAGSLEFVEVDAVVAPPAHAVLDRLAAGEITADEAIKELSS
jgi:hypothetical protein